MKCYYLGDKKITEAEAKEIEAKRGAFANSARYLSGGMKDGTHI